MGTLVALVGAGLVGLVAFGLWALDVFGVLRTDRYVKRMLTGVAVGLGVIALTSSGAFTEGVERFVAWRTAQEVERVNDMLNDLAPVTIAPATIEGTDPGG